MGWEDEHLYSFEKGHIIIEQTETASWFFPKRRDSMKGQIGNFLSETKEKITYTYDFGDNWEHQITVNKVMPDDPSIEHPECLLAQRACPPEDCGGIPGYMSIVRIFEPDMADELDEDDEGLLEWVGEDFDPEYVDINKINQELSEFWM